MRALTIELYDLPIGTLFEVGDRYGMTFTQEYAESYPPAVLSLSFLGASGRPRSPRNTRLRMLPFFANLLPEPNSTLRRYLSRQAGVNERDDMELLRALGVDLPGAITLKSAEWESQTHLPVRQAIPAARPLRFSLGGVQMKFSVRADGARFVLPPDGVGGTHILKLPEVSKPHLPENEASMMRLAAACGIPVPATKLVTATEVTGLPDRFSSFGGSAYIIERFDRAQIGKVHVEDFAQILRVMPEDKYERNSYDNLMRLCSQVLDEDGLADFVRRLVFTIAISNADMHLKNWSIYYPDRFKPLLSPAYDYVCTAAYPEYDNFLGLPLADTVQWSAITHDTFSRAARNARASARAVKRAVDEMTGTVKTVWMRARGDVPNNIRTVIDRQLEMPLFRRRAA
jgi:serine/threonine-protein kinase HipA